MMNPKDIRNKKMMEALYELKLPDDVMSELEAYLSGEKGEEALEKLAFQNLENVKAEKFKSLFYDLVNKKRKEEAEKLFNILFAIGQSTCYQLVPMNILSANESFTESDAAKKAAVYGVHIGMNQYGMHGYNIKALINMAGKSHENICKAIEYQKNDLDNGKVVLITAYFLIKYENRKLQEQTKEENKGFLAGVGKLLGLKGGQTGLSITMDKEDEPLMKQLEDIIIDSIHNLYQKQLPQNILQEITEALRNDKVDSRILQLAGNNHAYSDFLLMLLGGMAYLNYPLSDKLKNVVKVCLSINRDEMLNHMEKISTDTCMNLKTKGGNYDKVFGLASEDYIRWAALKGIRPILTIQLENNEPIYLDVMDKIGMEAANLMFSVIKVNNKALYDRLYAERMKNGNNKEMEKMINVLVPDVQHAEVFKEYLRGETEVSALYPYGDEVVQKYYYSGHNDRKLLIAYRDNYQDFDFFHRCQVYMLFKDSGYFFREDISEKYVYKPEMVKSLFDVFEGERLDMEHQLKGAILLYDSIYSDDGKTSFIDGVTQAFAAYLKQKREETVTAFAKAEAFGRFFGLHVMRKVPEEYKQEILSYSQDSAKMVKEELLDILYGQKGWESEIKALLASKKAAERELAIRVLLHWQGEEATYNELFVETLEKEKNAKVRSLLENALKLDGENSSGAKTLTQEDLVKELHKRGKKRSLAWAYETPFSEVHTADGEVADEEYLQAILLCYISADGCGVSKKAAVLAEKLNQAELAVYVNELFDKWMEAGAEAKKRWVLYAASIHGGADIVQKLHHQIQEWPQHARGAIAADAVQALALNPLPQALLIVDGISRKFKFKQVKAAAGKALEFAASQLGLTTEELADKIVPDLGFDENMERSFDYGERSFKVTITPALEIEVFDETGKKLKNMPAPGKKDDEQKATVAYDEFKLMKKQMKTTISSQKMRLEFALSTEREWTVEAWKALFVKNPIMHQFAIGLIWGIYEDKKLLQSFRYMEDGSFNTEGEDEYELPESGRIGLVHPIELSDESKEAWKQQLEDYEITQPIEQLNRPVFYMTEEEADMKSLERFGGYVLNDLSLAGKLQGMGWYRGSVQDAGGFYTYYREDAELSLGVELHFSGSYVGGDNGDITVYDARFYKAGAIARGSYMYEEADKEKSYFLKDIPARYFSEIVLQLTKATASSQEKEENWKAEAR